MKISAVLQLARNKFTRNVLAKRVRKKHMLKAKESSVKLHFTGFSRDKPSHEVPAKFSPLRFLSVTFLPFTHTTLITDKTIQGVIQIKNPKQVFTTQHIHLLERERATHPLVRNYCSLFSFPLPLLYFKRRFVHKHNSHLF